MDDTGPPMAGEPVAPLVRRRRRLLLIAVAAVLVSAVGLLSPLWVKSPQQVAAEAKPPPLTVLTATVDRRIVRDTMVLRGDVASQQTFSVTPSIRGDGRAIITAVRVKPGDHVASGAVVLEVSGRPLVVLPGVIPAYRDLTPGTTGKDVTQLQAALDGLGYHVTDRSGVFGAGTKHALTAFYGSRGYSPLPVSDTDEQQVTEAQREVTLTQRQVDDARDALNAVNADPATTQEQRTAAQKALNRAQADLKTARTSLAQVEARTGPMLPVGEYVFLPSFPARVSASKAVVGAEVATPLVTFATGRLVITAILTEAQHGLCKTGLPVQITEDTGSSATGSITSIGGLSIADGGGKDSGSAVGQAPGYPMVVTPDAALPESAAGLNVRLTVEVASTGVPQLAVPLSALFASADGGVYVIKRGPNGRDERIRVEPGMTGEGYVAITVLGGSLAPGDVVTVGIS